MQCVVYLFKCSLCDADYVGYTTRHLHQRIAEHKFSAIGKHLSRDVPDPDTGIRYPVKFRHPALSGIRYKFAGYLPDSTVRYFFTTMKRKSLLGVYKL
jgi:hypothetical protein